MEHPVFWRRAVGNTERALPASRPTERVSRAPTPHRNHHRLHTPPTNYRAPSPPHPLIIMPLPRRANSSPCPSHNQGSCVRAHVCVLTAAAATSAFSHSLCRRRSEFPSDRNAMQCIGGGPSVSIRAYHARSAAVVLLSIVFAFWPLSRVHQQIPIVSCRVFDTSTDWIRRPRPAPIAPPDVSNPTVLSHVILYCLLIIYTCYYYCNNNILPSSDSKIWETRLRDIVCRNPAGYSILCRSNRLLRLPTTAVGGFLRASSHRRRVLISKLPINALFVRLSIYDDWFNIIMDRIRSLSQQMLYVFLRYNLTLT